MYVLHIRGFSRGCVLFKGLLLFFDHPSPLLKASSKPTEGLPTTQYVVTSDKHQKNHGLQTRI